MRWIWVVGAGGLGLVAPTLSSVQEPWVRWEDGIASFDQDYMFDVAIDADDNVYVTGSFSRTISIGGKLLTSRGREDMFLVKYDPSGSVLWSRAFGGPLIERGEAVAATSDGGVVVGGLMQTGVDFGGGELSYAGGGTDMFVVKFDADGNHEWSRSLGANRHEICNGASPTSDGGVVLCGWFSRVTDFGEGAVSGNGDHAFLLRLDAAGENVWTVVTGGTAPASTVAHDVDVDVHGDVVVIGEFRGTTDLGGELLTSAGNLDIFVGKLDADGQHLWSTSFGGPLPDRGYGIGTDSEANVLCTGFQSKVDFGVAEAEFTGMFTYKAAPTGVVEWVRTPTADEDTEGRDVAADGGGNVFVTGSTYLGFMDFGCGSQGLQFDTFALKVGPSGEYVWSGAFGGYFTGSALRANGYGVSVDSRGYAAVVGAGGSPVPSEESGLGDGFVRLLSDVPSVPVLVDAVRSTWQDDHVRIEWRLGGDVRDIRTRVLRAVADRSFAPLGSIVDERDGRSFRVEDRDAPRGAIVRYRIELVDGAGESTAFETALATPPPFVAHLSSAPNPTHSATTVRFELADPSTVSLRVFDAKGALVRTLVDGAVDAGRHDIRWDGRGDDGERLSSGRYFVRLLAGGGGESYAVSIVR